MSDEAVRSAQRRAFASAHAAPAAGLTPLPADASPRRYFRLPGQGLLLMDSPPNAADFSAFLTIARHLRQLGLSSPAVLAADAAAGLALIEDFGEDTFTRLLARGRNETELYDLATDTLAALHGAAGATAVNVPAYDEAPLFDELRMFTRWYAPEVAPGLDVPAFETDFLGHWHAALAEVAERREVLVLRDYHVDNLMIVPGRTGIAACGLLDFQDALCGAAAYDLVSLTQDARRDIAPALEARLRARYLAQRPALDQVAFTQDYWCLAAQRHTKILGNFLRLSRRDGKHGYLRHIPRVQRLLARALFETRLPQIRALLDSALPGWAEFRPLFPSGQTERSPMTEPAPAALP